MRSDTERNRRQLIRAATRLYEASTGPVSMTAIAKEAEVSPATAYRQFTSVDEILAEFRLQVGCEMRDFSKEQTSHGLERLEAVSRFWISLVLEHGAAMVPMRSRQGYLERLREGTEYLMPQAEALREPLRETTDELGLPDIGDEAVFLWNVLFDPREVLDLVNTVGLSEQQVGTQLVAALRGALDGYAHARKPGKAAGTSRRARKRT